jgi:predicted TIM-barrel fold metal-dependent hydrolase
VPADFDDTLINGPPNDGPVIDCHCHAGTGDGLTGPWDTTAPLRDYCRRAAAAGIDGTVLFAPFSSDYAAANDQVARIVARDPRRFVGFAFVHPERDRGRIGELVDRAVRRHGFRGIKAHRHDGRLTREVCEVADRWRLPVLYDPMGEIAPIELVATEYPRVAFIVPHLGSFADDWRAQREFLDVLTRHPNVHTDTSGVRRFDLLVEAVARAGPAKVLFGTDGPWLHPGVELAKVHALRLRPGARRLVLGGNLLRLVARVRTGPALPVASTGELPAAADPWRRR